MSQIPPPLLENILNGVSDAAFFLDRQRIVRAANDAAWRAFGKVALNQDFVKAMRRPEVLQLIDECLANGGQAQEILTLDATLRGTYRVTASSVNSIGIVVSFTDLTDIHAAERMRSDFVANVSHELRSPLTTISGFIETLQGPARNDETAQTRFLDLMQQEAGRMERLIDDLLSLSKVEGDTRVRVREKVDLADLTSRVIAMLSHHAAQREVSIEMQGAPADLLVDGDEDQLTQVFRNLVENAVKYGAAAGAVTVTLDRLPTAAGIQGTAISIAIKDEGPGIAKHHLPRLTERFYRVDDGRSRDKGGTGLGLAIVKHIIQRHRGRMLIDSTEGVGSTFTVLLPEAG